MKCLLVADLHYDLRKFDWVAACAPLVDVLVLAGDHLEIASMVARPAQAVVVQKYLRRIQSCTKLLVCSGNHDLDVPDANGELTAEWIANLRYRGIPTDGDTVVVEDTLFTLCPWWDGEKQKAKVAEQLARDATQRRSTWIWVHHAPPDNSPTSWGGRRSFGDAALRGWIEQYSPEFVLSGHVHQSPYVPGGSWVDRIGNTWVFNAGHQTGGVPSHIAVDTSVPEAYWLSLVHGEVQALDQPLTRPLPRLRDMPEWLVKVQEAGLGQP